jgi:hypothetical protein
MQWESQERIVRKWKFEKWKYDGKANSRKVKFVRKAKYDGKANSRKAKFVRKGKTGKHDCQESGNRESEICWAR